MAQHDGGERRSAAPAPASDSASPAATNGCKIAIRRNGNAVEVTLTSADDYASIQLYDSLVQSAETGCLRLEVSLARS